MQRTRDRMNEAGAKLTEAETRFWAELTEALDEDGEPGAAPQIDDAALLAELAEVYAANERARAAEVVD